jgi:hypothetical protein
MHYHCVKYFALHGSKIHPEYVTPQQIKLLRQAVKEQFNYMCLRTGKFLENQQNFIKYKKYAALA